MVACSSSELISLQEIKLNHIYFILLNTHIYMLLFIYMSFSSTAGLQWLGSISLAVAVNVQSVGTTACFSSVAGTSHVAPGISIWRNGVSVGEAVTAV